MTHQNNPSQSWAERFEKTSMIQVLKKATDYNRGQFDLVMRLLDPFIQSVHDEAYKAGEDNAIAQINKLREAPELTKDS